MPLNAPSPLGKELFIRAFVDTDFSGDTVTCRSCTGFIIIETYHLYIGCQINKVV